MIWLILLPTAILNIKEKRVKSVMFWCSTLYLILSCLTFYDYFVYSGMSGDFRLMVKEYRFFASLLFGVSVGLIIDFFIRFRKVLQQKKEVTY